MNWFKEILTSKKADARDTGSLIPAPGQLAVPGAAGSPRRGSSSSDKAAAAAAIAEQQAELQAWMDGSWYAFHLAAVQVSVGASLPDEAVATFTAFADLLVDSPDRAVDVPHEVYVVCARLLRSEFLVVSEPAVAPLDLPHILSPLLRVLAILADNADATALLVLAQSGILDAAIPLLPWITHRVYRDLELSDLQRSGHIDARRLLVRLLARFGAPQFARAVACVSQPADHHHVDHEADADADDDAAGAVAADDPACLSLFRTGNSALASYNFAPVCSAVVKLMQDTTLSPQDTRDVFLMLGAVVMNNVSAQNRLFEAEAVPLLTQRLRSALSVEVLAPPGDDEALASAGAGAWADAAYADILLLLLLLREAVAMNPRSWRCFEQHGGPELVVASIFWVHEHYALHHTALDPVGVAAAITADIQASIESGGSASATDAVPVWQALAAGNPGPADPPVHPTKLDLTMPRGILACRPMACAVKVLLMFLVDGPCPDAAAPEALLQHWSDNLPPRQGSSKDRRPSAAASSGGGDERTGVARVRPAMLAVLVQACMLSVSSTPRPNGDAIDADDATASYLRRMPSLLRDARFPITSVHLLLLLRRLLHLGLPGTLDVLRAHQVWTAVLSPVFLRPSASLSNLQQHRGNDDDASASASPNPSRPESPRASSSGTNTPASPSAFRTRGRLLLRSVRSRLRLHDDLDARQAGVFAWHASGVLAVDTVAAAVTVALAQRHSASAEVGALLGFLSRHSAPLLLSDLPAVQLVAQRLLQLLHCHQRPLRADMLAAGGVATLTQVASCVQDLAMNSDAYVPLRGLVLPLLSGVVGQDRDSQAHVASHPPLIPMVLRAASAAEGTRSWALGLLTHLLRNAVVPDSIDSADPAEDAAAAAAAASAAASTSIGDSDGGSADDIGVHQRVVGLIRQAWSAATTPAWPSSSLSLLLALLDVIRASTTDAPPLQQRLWVRGGVFPALLAVMQPVLPAAPSSDAAAAGLIISSDTMPDAAAAVVVSPPPAAMQSKVVRATLRAFGAVLAHNTATKAVLFAEPCLEQRFADAIVAAEHKVTRPLMMLLFDAMVDGVDRPFDLHSNHLLHSPYFALLLLQSLWWHTDAQLRGELLSMLTSVASQALVNRARLCDAGASDAVLALLSHPKLHPRFRGPLLRLLQLLGSHSLSVRNLRALLALAAPVEGNFRPVAWQSTLMALAGMCAAPGPETYFIFDGASSALHLTDGLDRWPASGFSVAIWLCADALKPGQIAPLFSATQPGSRAGFHAYFNGNQLVLETSDEKGKPSALPLDPAQVRVPEQTWCFLVLTHTPSRVPWGTADARVYCDGELAGKGALRYPEFAASAPVASVWFGAAPAPHQQQHASEFVGSGGFFSGQIGSIWLFDEALSTASVAAINALGPHYLGTFQAQQFTSYHVPLLRGVAAAPRQTSPTGARDSAGSLSPRSRPLAVLSSGHLAGRVIAAYHANACRLGVALDLAGATGSSALRRHNARLQHVQLARVQDARTALYCLGGVRVLLPLFAQLDLPIVPRAGSGSINYTVDSSHAVQLISLLASVLKHSIHLQDDLLATDGPAMIAYLLSIVSPQHLGQNLIDVCRDLVRVLPRQLGDSLFLSLLADLTLWLHTDAVVQQYLLSTLASMLSEDRARFRVLCSVEHLLDALRVCYWYVREPGCQGQACVRHSVTGEVIGGRPSDVELLELRPALMHLIRQVMMMNPTPAEVLAIVRFLCDVSCPWLQRDVLGMLDDMLAVGIPPNLPGLLVSEAGSEIWLQLAGSREDETRVLALRVFGRLAVGSPTLRRRVSLDSSQVFWMTLARRMAATSLTDATFEAMQCLLTESFASAGVQDDTGATAIRNPGVLYTIVVLAARLPASNTDLRQRVLRSLLDMVEASAGNREAVRRLYAWPVLLLNLIDDHLPMAALRVDAVPVSPTAGATSTCAGTGPVYSSSHASEYLPGSPWARLADTALSVFACIHYSALVTEKAGWRVIAQSLSFLAPQRSRHDAFLASRMLQDVVSMLRRDLHDSASARSVSRGEVAASSVSSSRASLSSSASQSSKRSSDPRDLWKSTHLLTNMIPLVALVEENVFYLPVPPLPPSVFAPASVSSASSGILASPPPVNVSVAPPCPIDATDHGIPSPVQALAAAAAEAAAQEAADVVVDADADDPVLKFDSDHRDATAGDEADAAVVAAVVDEIIDSVVAAHQVACHAASSSATVTATTSVASLGSIESLRLDDGERHEAASETNGARHRPSPLHVGHRLAAWAAPVARGLASARSAASGVLAGGTGGYGGDDATSSTQRDLLRVGERVQRQHGSDVVHEDTEPSVGRVVPHLWRDTETGEWQDLSLVQDLLYVVSQLNLTGAVRGGVFSSSPDVAVLRFAVRSALVVVLEGSDDDVMLALDMLGLLSDDVRVQAIAPSWVDVHPPELRDAPWSMLAHQLLTAALASIQRQRDDVVIQLIAAALRLLLAKHIDPHLLQPSEGVAADADGQEQRRARSASTGSDESDDVMDWLRARDWAPVLVALWERAQPVFDGYDMAVPQTMERRRSKEIRKAWQAARSFIDAELAGFAKLSTACQAFVQRLAYGAVSRRAASSRCSDEDRRALAARWRTELRSLTSAYGPWRGASAATAAGSTPSTGGEQDEVEAWKLDPSEDWARRRRKLRRNYTFDDHRRAIPQSSGAHASSPAAALSKSRSTVSLLDAGAASLRRLRGLRPSGMHIAGASDTQSRGDGGNGEDGEAEWDLMLPSAQDSDAPLPSPATTPSKSSAAGAAGSSGSGGAGGVAGSGAGGAGAAAGGGAGDGLPPPNEERTVLCCACELVTPMVTQAGELEVSNRALYFRHQAATEAVSIEQGTASIQRDFHWSLASVRELHVRRYMLRRSALEIFMTDRTTVLLHFPTGMRNKVFRKLVALAPPNLVYHDSRKPSAMLRASGLTERWQRRQISNFEYLMALNTLAGRTYNDLTQYPVFPWVLSCYERDSFNLLDPECYRDLGKPIGALGDKKRLQQVLERYATFEDPEIPKFHYGSHYSSSGIVLHYLVRMEPFTSLFLLLQGGKFDAADRMFGSIPQAWRNVMSSGSDVKELIPEFYYLPEFLRNENGFEFGRKQNGEALGDVVLPRWASDADTFIRVHAAALESEYVSRHLHEWIDLVFGWKQRGAAAVEAVNVFYYLTYEGAVDLDAIEDPLTRRAMESQIVNFGQTPVQLLTQPHPARGTAPPPDLLQLLKREDALIMAFALRVTTDPADAVCAVRCFGDVVVTLTSSQRLAMHRWSPGCVNATQATPFTLELDAWGSGMYLGAPRARGFTAFPGVLFAVSRDARFAWTCGSWDHAFRMWQLDSHAIRLVHIVDTHKDVVSCVAVGSDGATLVTGSLDTTLIIWDVVVAAGSGFRASTAAPPRLRHRVFGHTSAVTSVAVSSELDVMVSASLDGPVLMHVLTTGSLVRCVRHNASAVRRGALTMPWLLAVSRHGHVVVYASNEARLSVYTINGRMLAGLDVVARQDEIRAVEFSRSADFLACACVGGLVIRRSYDLTEVRRFPSATDLRSVAWAGSQDHIFAGTRDGHLFITFRADDLG